MCFSRLVRLGQVNAGRSPQGYNKDGALQGHGPSHRLEIRRENTIGRGYSGRHAIYGKAPKFLLVELTKD